MSDGLKMKYFVLKPHGADVYARASRAAMFVYAHEISADNTTFAHEVWGWVERERLLAQDPQEHACAEHPDTIALRECRAELAEANLTIDRETEATAHWLLRAEAAEARLEVVSAHRDTLQSAFDETQEKFWDAFGKRWVVTAERLPSLLESIEAEAWHKDGTLARIRQLISASKKGGAPVQTSEPMLGAAEPGCLLSSAGVRAATAELRVTQLEALLADKELLLERYAEQKDALESARAERDTALDALEALR
jgi:chaperonin cofactor prefoldin